MEAGEPKPPLLSPRRLSTLSSPSSASSQAISAWSKPPSLQPHPPCRVPRRSRPPRLFPPPSPLSRRGPKLLRRPPPPGPDPNQPDRNRVHATLLLLPRSEEHTSEL